MSFLGFNGHTLFLRLLENIASFEGIDDIFGGQFNISVICFGFKNELCLAQTDQRLHCLVYHFFT